MSVAKTLYAWYAGYASAPTVLYTSDEIPSSTTKYYNGNLEEIDISSISYDDWYATDIKYAYTDSLAFNCNRKKG